jgi:uncharacterized protein (DUF1800 family)
MVAAGLVIFLTGRAAADVNPEINREVWKQKFGVLDAQWDQQSPYLGWHDQDADGDGVSNRDEFTAGTNPFKKIPGEAHFRAPAVTTDPSSLSLTFPTVPGKLYGAESSESLIDTWSKGSLPTVTGDGSVKMLTVPKSAGKFFHLTVTDQATQGDQVSDWAKSVLGLSMNAPLTSQTSFDHSSLAANLQEQNVVSLAAVDLSGALPADPATPAGDFGLIRVNRSGSMQLGAVTVPISKSGTAVEGVDFAAIPGSITFPPGVNSIDVKISPLFNASRTSSATVFLTANPPGSAGSGGDFTLGAPASAGVTLYPSGNPAGTGLTGTYHPGGSATYTSPLNLSDQRNASYAYTRISSTTGTAIVSFYGTPATPFTEGAQVNLQVVGGQLNISPFNTLRSYTVKAPVTSNSFVVDITGTGLPSSSSSSSNILGIANYFPVVTKLAPVIDYTWGHGSPNGTNLVGADNYSVRWEGWLEPATGSYVFRLDADDKARVLIDKGDGNGLQQVLENGWDTSATGGYKLSAPIAFVAPAAPADRYFVRVEFAETTGSAKCRFQWQLNGGSFANIPSASVFKDNSGTTTGWQGSYFNNSTLTAPAVNPVPQTDSDITGSNNGDWLTGSPDPQVFHNNYSSRWTGQILPQYSQLYYFVVKANQGAKLWIDNQLIIDRWDSATSERTGSIQLQADVLYDIKLEQHEVTGSSEAHLSWYSEDQAKQIIPTNRLFPSSSSVPGLAENPAGAPAITSPTHPIVILGLNPPFSLPVTSSNGGTISASGMPGWLTLTNGVLTGIPPAAGIYQFTVTTTNAAGSGSAVITLEVIAAGNQLTRELWNSGVTGPALTDVPWNEAPTASDTVSIAEDATTTYQANTGERLRGYFVAPATGNYYFWISASNEAELWISNDAEPVNKVRRAQVTGPSGTAARTWNSQPNQKSQWLSLVAGKKYYIEALLNTGADPAANHLSIAWFLDPTGTTDNPISNGCLPAPAEVGGVIPTHVISPWDNPPTIAVPGKIHVTNLQGVQGLSNITATGAAFLRVNGSTAVLQLSHSGLTSGIISRKVYNGADEVIFDLDAQDKNYPALKTSDGGYTWAMQPDDLTALNNAEASIRIATISHPDGEITGTFGRTSGSQTPPPAPAYPAWTDLHATSDAENSRFLSQATFGPSPGEMDAVKTGGYRTWIENQFILPPTRSVPDVLANLSNDPQNPYGSTLFFNSWWKNSVTAPDQLRQRAAFALSEILVVSDTGPLNNNGRALADYYDTLLDHGFGNFRDILKQVTLSPAMGVYLDMRGNGPGNIQTGFHPNENYAREILQLFSAGLYRVWPDGSLVLDSRGNAVPTYDQSVISGMARVFTGWTWGQKMVGGRLPTIFNPSSNNLDPMVLVANKHELGSKILLDNVVLPAATVVNQSDASTDPTSTYTVQSTDPDLGPGNLVTTLITNQYDLNGVRDLEITLDNILNNSATGPYICRQLIQRLVTSHPKPDYVHRVVRAFDGEQNVDGVRTGVRGDMKEVFRAILLDYEARSPAAAADSKFGKQREPVLRVTGPARAFPSSTFPNSSYSQSGSGSILVTTPAPHRLVSGESVRLSNFVDAGGSSTQLPTAQTYVIENATANSFTVGSGASTNPNYSSVGNTVTVTASGFAAGDQVYIKFTSGGLAGAGFDGPYTVATAAGSNFNVTLTSSPANASGATMIPRLTGGYNVTTTAGVLSILLQTSGNHNLSVGESVQVKFLVTNSPIAAQSGVYSVTSIAGPNSFRITPPTTISNGSQGTSGMAVYPLKESQWTRSGTVTVSPSTWGVGYTQNNLNQTPLNATTVFNFFYPDYQYPGDLAKAGMTTPEFQLTNDSNTMNLTNLITQGTLTANNGNTAGHISFFSGSAITLDLAGYMTAGQTSNAAIPDLVDQLGVLLSGGNLSAAARTTISNYVANNTNFPYTTPTNTQMRDRVRAIVHLIATSADYAIQK